jgi:class 3 adenylate cyclase
MKPPRIKWTKTPDGVRIAYQVFGDGPIDLVFCSPNNPNLDLLWDDPARERFFRRLGSFSRLLLYNQRGTGISDPAPRGVTAMEELVADLRSVLDAAGSERAALLGVEAGVHVPSFLAATSPERVQALVLLEAFATWHHHDDYPWGFPEQALERFIETSLATYGTGEDLRHRAPELFADERFKEEYARLDRVSHSPAALEPMMRSTINDFDLRGVLSAIQAPTLVISHASHPFLRLGHGRYVAEHIPTARYIEREGFWGIFWVHDVDWLLDETQAFLTGTRGATDLEDRVLATVLFTDIVGSTERAAELGDRRWRQLLDEHDAAARRQIEAFRGRALKSTGDGVMATFDGPARGIRCALAIKDALREIGVEIRTGLHTGEVEQRGEDVGGIAVHIAARVMGEAGANEVLVSGAVPPLVAGSQIEFDDRGTRQLKGVPGEWRLYAVKG